MEGCRKNPPKVLSVGCCDQPTLFHKVTIPAAIGDETTDPPLPGKYRNVLLVYETTGNAYLYSSDGMPTQISEIGEIDRLEKLIKEEEEAREDADNKLEDAIIHEGFARVNADDEIWNEIRTIEAASDVVDVVGTYADLEAYDTSKLHDNDLIKVLQDETHGDAITYYRWSTTTETFSYVGEQGPYYTQAQTDILLNGKQDVLTAGDNITISNDVISATDTTYTAGTGLTLTGTEFAVDTTVIAEKSDLPTKTSDLTNDGSDGTSTYVEADSLATVATSGSYTDLSNTPTIPTATSDLTNDSGFITSSSLPGDMTGATSGTAGAHGLVPAPAAGDENKVLSGAGTWVAVSSGGSYSAGNGISIDANNEISIDSSVVAEVSDIPTQTSDLTNDGSDGTSTYVEADELATVATSGSFNDLIDQPTIPAAQVNSDWNASSGVAEILNKPTIPTVNNATLTVTQNGTSAGTFTANASSDVTIALTDTTYSAFSGTDGQAAGSAGLVPAPATTDAGKFLKADGTWGTITATTTVFYSSANFEGWDDGTQWQVYFYTDSAMTTYATGDDIYNAFQNGDVVIRYYNTYTTCTTYYSIDHVTKYDVTGMVDIYVVSGNWQACPSCGFDILDVRKYTSNNFWSIHKVYKLQEKLTAGSGITISGNTISATAPTYTAGDNITISGSTISASDALIIRTWS